MVDQASPDVIFSVASLASLESMLSSPPGVVVVSPCGLGRHAAARMAAQPLGGDPPEAPIPLLGSQSVVLLPSPEAKSHAPELAGAELLRSVFDTMAVNGRITMDQLPFVLAGAEVDAAAEQVQEAIERFVPDADDGEALLEFDAVQTLYHQLAQVVTDAAVGVLEGPEVRPSALQRLWQWLQQRNKERGLRQTAYERHLKPTTRLLLLILFMSCVISTAVVVFSVFLIFNHSNDAVINHLVRDTEL
eukprot:EG_transcript_25993